MPAHNYIYAPTREHWPSGSVDARVLPVRIKDASGKPKLDTNGKPIEILASVWLDKHQSVEQISWAPGGPMLIRDRLIREGGWIERHGVTWFNLYRPPTLEPGDTTERRVHGLSMCVRFSATTPIILLSGSPIGCSVRRRR